MKNRKDKMTFDRLVSSIQQVHGYLSAQAGKAINISLTMRNWAIGFYIEEYERVGVDRAAYGERLMDDLSKTLQDQGLSRCDRRELYRYRQFYAKYPQIVESLTPQLVSLLRLAGMDNGLFVSRYQLELPKKEEMQRFIEEQMRKAGDL